MDLSEFESTLHDCETRLDRLRALYEQYFQGMERLEPLIPKKELQRRVQLLKRNIPRNTALRFRYQMLVQKYTTYQSYWQRVSRQIEEGTYRRDVMKARRQREEARVRRRDVDEPRSNPADGYDIDIDVDVEEEVAAAKADVLAALDNLGPRSAAPRGATRQSLSPFATPSKAPSVSVRGQPDAPSSKVFGRPSKLAPKQGSPERGGFEDPSPRGAREKPTIVNRPPSAPAAANVIGGPDDHGMRRVYDRYVDARRRNHERVDNVRFESVKKSIEKQLPKLRQKHQGKNIDFEVVIRNGKVGLKPVPK